MCATGTDLTYLPLLSLVIRFEHPRAQYTELWNKGCRSDIYHLRDQRDLCCGTRSHALEPICIRIIRLRCSRR